MSADNLHESIQLTMIMHGLLAKAIRTLLDSEDQADCVNAKAKSAEGLR